MLVSGWYLPGDRTNRQYVLLYKGRAGPKLCRTPTRVVRRRQCAKFIRILYLRCYRRQGLQTGWRRCLLSEGI